LRGGVKARVAKPILDGLRKPFGLAQCVRDALRRCEVLEVPRVADENPAGPGGLPE